MSGSDHDDGDHDDGAHDDGEHDDGEHDDGEHDGQEEDALLARRARFARAAAIGQRAGYAAFGVAVVAFVVGAAAGLNQVVVAVVIGALVVGSLLLAPAIILGYAVRAAEREDREQRR